MYENYAPGTTDVVVLMVVLVAIAALGTMFINARVWADQLAREARAKKAEGTTPAGHVLPMGVAEAEAAAAAEEYFMNYEQRAEDGPQPEDGHDAWCPVSPCICDDCTAW